MRRQWGGAIKAVSARLLGFIGCLTHDLRLACTTVDSCSGGGPPGRMSPPDTTKAKAPRRRWAGNLFHRIVDRSMLRRGKDFETRIAEFFKDGAHLKRFIKDFMSADVTEINPAFYRARTPQEMIDAPLEHQKRDKYNVLGGGYTSPWNKYKIIRTLGKGGFGKVFIGSLTCHLSLRASEGARPLTLPGGASRVLFGSVCAATLTSTSRPRDRFTRWWTEKRWSRMRARKPAR